jgi:hypothetical protein
VPVLAEFATPEALARAALRLRELGYSRMDAFTPYAVPVVDEALRVRRSPAGWIAFVGAMGGVAFAYVVQWAVSALLYPLNVGGRPAHAAPSFVPITFETAVLFGAGAAFVGLFALGRLTRLWDPVFDVPGFETASDDRFWLAVDALDPVVARDAVERELEGAGALRVERAEGSDG